MNVLIAINLRRGWRYLAKKTIDYGGNQYVGKILEITPLRVRIGDNKDYQTSSITITLNNTNGDFTDIMNDEWNQFIEGVELDLYQTDGTPIRKFFIEKAWPGREEKFFIIASDKYAEMNENVIETIDENFYPDAGTTEAYNQPINRIYRNNDALATTGYIKCWRVEKGPNLD